MGRRVEACMIADRKSDPTLSRPYARRGMKMRSLKTGGRFIAFMVVVVCAIGDPAAQNSNETPYAATRLIGRWRTIMNQTLEDARAFAAEEVTDLMEAFVSPGAVRAVQD